PAPGAASVLASGVILALYDGLLLWTQCGPDRSSWGRRILTGRELFP
ncbi:hypothetical protein GS982_32010, partial [Rhodococcus hoagii]|nr:hypothetical protein [Prescottella equi]